MAETFIYPENNSGGTVPAWMAAMNNGGLGGNWGGLGGGVLGFLLGLFFGNGYGGWGGNGFGGNAGGAGFLSNQINNDNGRDLLMAAINSNGEASRAAIQNLATMLGQDFNLVNSGVQGIPDRHVFPANHQRNTGWRCIHAGSVVSVLLPDEATRDGAGISEPDCHAEPDKYSDRRNLRSEG